MVQALWLEQEVDALVSSGHRTVCADCSQLATIKTRSAFVVRPCGLR